MVSSFTGKYIYVCFMCRVFLCESKNITVWFEQIALKNGCPQDWGLVEYSTSEDAETAQTTLNGFSLHGQNIRICYYIPGVRAINLYLKLLNDSVSWTVYHVIFNCDS
jgi:RNA recognition motif-containing protein